MSYRAIPGPYIFRIEDIAKTTHTILDRKVIGYRILGEQDGKAWVMYNMEAGDNLTLVYDIE